MSSVEDVQAMAAEMDTWCTNLAHLHAYLNKRDYLTDCRKKPEDRKKKPLRPVPARGSYPTKAEWYLACLEWHAEMAQLISHKCASGGSDPEAVVDNNGDHHGPQTVALPTTTPHAAQPYPTMYNNNQAESRALEFSMHSVPETFPAQRQQQRQQPSEEPGQRGQSLNVVPLPDVGNEEVYDYPADVQCAAQHVEGTWSLQSSTMCSSPSAQPQQLPYTPKTVTFRHEPYNFDVSKVVYSEKKTN